MIIFIESNTSGYGEHILHYCKEQQIDFIFVTDNIKKYSDLDSLKHSMNILSSHELNQQILSGKSSGRLYASTSDSQIFKAFVLSNKKEDTKFVETCRDKLKLQNLLYSNTFFAKKLSINTLDELNLTSLYVVKPNKGTGSMNILIDNGNQLKIDCLELVNSDSDYIIETFIDGKEYSAEFIISNGQTQLIAIFRKHTHRRHRQQEIMHILCSYDKYIDERLSYEINKVIRHARAYAINIFLHVEFKIKDRSLHIIEINPRLCGSLLPFAIKLMYKNLDFDKIFIDLILGNLKADDLKSMLNYQEDTGITAIVVCSTTTADQTIRIENLFKENSLLIKKQRQNINFIDNCQDFRGRHTTFLIQDRILDISTIKAVLDVDDE